ncbi:hypothetical protein NLI96_g12305 [Meripilus lineatus]|uniref:Uncharacterized protein n=1 Tax=Meripilus lineatus TaxID=2056292 RepID=A0AAD5YA03_9APHY|nr:hypothetical protein NLI96_g12305 [Physisporinus lineatus]
MLQTRGEGEGASSGKERNVENTRVLQPLLKPILALVAHLPKIDQVFIRLYSKPVKNPDMRSKRRFKSLKEGIDTRSRYPRFGVTSAELPLGEAWGRRRSKNVILCDDLASRGLGGNKLNDGRDGLRDG